VNPAESLQSNPAEIAWLSIAIAVLVVAIALAVWARKK
jgi:hypothetical protein